VVWSDQTQFPFQVIDNAGNIIFIIDEQGFRLEGTQGEIKGEITPLGLPQLVFGVPNVAGSGLLRYFPGGGWGGTGLAISAQTGTNPQVNQIFLSTTGFVSMRGGDGINDANGPIVACDSTTVQFKNDINQVNPVTYSASTKWMGARDQGWTPITLSNGWVGNAAWPTPAMKVTSSGMVVMRGMLNPGITGDNTIVMQVPNNSFMPSGIGGSNAIIKPTCNGGSNGRLFLNGSNGFFYVYGVVGATELGLDGCSYAIDHA